MHLKHGAALQGGKYRIEKLLGQGGFGITYLAVQTGLNRMVAIKEFFMKEHCNRDADTSCVSVPSVGSRELVAKFKDKFIREAQMIYDLKHQNIILIRDFFEENGTAYYVMEYHDGGSLGSLPLPLTAEEASVYIRQVASALSYLHDRNTMHLDVKPSNVLIDKEGNAVLIDFGISKHYDYDGHQTSSTPVGISKGYAPIEQYSQSTLEFNPATDIYSLGATLYKLLTGDTPPEASLLVSNPKLLIFPSSVSEPMAALIRRCLSPSLDARPQCISEFLGLLDDALATASVSDDTVVETEKDEYTVIVGNDNLPSEKKKSRRWLWWLLAAVILVVAGVVAVMSSKSGDETAVASTAERAVPQHEIDKAAYDSLMTAASKVSLSDLASYDEAIGLYEQAKEYEVRYGKTEYLSLFSRDSQQKIADLKDARGQLKASMSEADQAKSDARTYADLMEMGAEYEEKDEYLEQAREKYSSAKELEDQWSKSKDYGSLFSKDATEALNRVEDKLKELEKAESRKKAAEKQFNEDLSKYNQLISDADKLYDKGDESSLKSAFDKYDSAAEIESRYEHSEYSDRFNRDAFASAGRAEKRLSDVQAAAKSASLTGTHKNHEWVDLGLSVKWATCNVGASRPGDYGKYYAWGEVVSMEEGNESDSRLYVKSKSDIRGNSTYDAARANWGGDWRLPTKAECQELLANCTWEWTTQNGHNGYKVTGPNGNSIFLPAAGCRYSAYEEKRDVGSYGGYWSSTPYEDYTSDACSLYFGEGYRDVYRFYRGFWRSVRPVLE